jgi:hypothetical protein
MSASGLHHWCCQGNLLVELDDAAFYGAACVMQQQLTPVALAVPIPLLSLAR